MRQLMKKAFMLSMFLPLMACTGSSTTKDDNPKIGHESDFSFVLGSRTFTPKAVIAKNLIKRISTTANQRASLSQKKVKPAHILIQFKEPLSQQYIKVLNTRGIKIYNKINPYTWIATTDFKGATSLAKLDLVRWADVYPVSAKLSKDINEKKPYDWQMRDNNSFVWSVLFHDDVSTNEVSRLQKSIPGLKMEGFNSKSFKNMKLTKVILNAGDVNKLAAYDIVRWIEPEEPPHIPDNQANAQPLSNVDDVQIAPYNLSGTGVSVGVWEANEPGTNGIVRNTHQDLTGRTTLAADQTVPTPAVYSYHATHVAGSIGASGVNSPAAEGMAPAATLVSWSSANDSAEMTSAVTSAGGAADPVPITLSNHSYGIGIGWAGNGSSFTPFTNFGQYRNTSQSFDAVVNAGLTVFKSAGNDRNDLWDGATVIPGAPTGTRDCTQGAFGVDADCLGPRSCAKNIITVGAMANAANIANFSSYGPTDDGRIKPDIMADGTALTSLTNASNTSTGPNSGTSMATPVVTGIAALLVEEASNQRITLSPAAMKALLIQSAQDVAGVGQSTVGPDYSTGWGIADAQAAADLLRLPGGAGIAQESISVTGAAGAYSQPFFVPAGETEVHVTLAWSDLPGNPATPSGAQLVNDLDLRLIAPDGTTILTPWTLNPANPGNAAVRNGGDDAINNVEQVSVLNPVSGVWYAQVTAKAGSLASGAQDFALAGPLTPVTGPITSNKADVMMVLDRSGSMIWPSTTAGMNKLQALQSSATEFLDFMEIVGGHQVGLVQFDTNIFPFAPPFDLQPLDSTSIAAARTAVADMTTGVYTNIIDGITTAEGQLSSPAASNPEKVVLLFSDGKHNRPIGSDVSDIDTTMDADTKFYAIGFGTDVDSTVMPTVAANHDGLYLEEQTLSAAQLSKMFLTIAGLTVDETIVVDPDYVLTSNQTAQQNVYLTKSDRSVTFATHWNSANANQMSIRVTGPDRTCKIPTNNHQGYKTRNGQHYRLIRITLPYRCKSGQLMHAGNWRLLVTNSGSQQDTAKVMVLADSALKLKANVKVKGDYAYITASLTNHNKRISPRAQIYGALARRLPGSHDSEKQDASGKITPIDPGNGGVLTSQTLRVASPGVLSMQPEQILKLPRASLVKGGLLFNSYQLVKDKPQLIQLNDAGKLEDIKNKDGIFSAIVKLNKKGFYQARIISKMKTKNGTITREIPISFLIK